MNNVTISLKDKSTRRMVVDTDTGKPVSVSNGRQMATSGTVVVMTTRSPWGSLIWQCFDTVNEKVCNIPKGIVQYPHAMEHLLHRAS